MAPEDIIMLAEVGLLRPHMDPNGGRFIVYGLGNRYLVYDLMVQAEAARRLQGQSVPPDCHDFIERGSLVDLLRAVFAD
jgi:hypothetical protein